MMDNHQKKTKEAFKITGNWDTKAKHIQDKFPQLTESDLKYETGKEEELLGRIENRLNKKREEVINILNKDQVSQA
jgi:uncharacterized protein YjbJ (UPF0337 family)